MRTLILLATMVLLNVRAFSQINLQQFNSERISFTKNGMLVLGSWGAANVIAGAIGQSSSNGETKYFNQMNLIWGAVNFAIAAPTYFSVKKQRTDLSLSESVKQQSNIEKTFLFNAGLDLVYITGGVYCIGKADNDSKHDLYRGYGKSLQVQGCGLLLFDVTMYILHVNHEKQLYKILNSVQVSGKSVGIIWKL